MLVQSIYLSNFRNYSNLKLDLNPNVNIFVGRNAQGKTNILEAIFYAATGKSHRTNYDSELIRWGEKSFYIKLKGIKTSGEVKVEISVRNDGKKILKVNNQLKKKLSELIGIVNIVLFSPEDMMLVKGGPSIRRKFLDIEICQISPYYCHTLANYNKVLNQRNNLLKSIREKGQDYNLLDVWDSQLVEYGTYLIKKRIEVLNKVSQIAHSIHRKISQGTEDLKVSYMPSIFLNYDNKTDSYEDIFLKKLKDNRDKEIKKGVTVLGPHRDDIEIKIGNNSVKSFGSQGQQRTSALSMKLSELEFLKNETGEYPILLMDDVMSELDGWRRKFLMDIVNGKVQVFVTTTEIKDIFEKMINKSTIFEVEHGNTFINQEV